MGHPTGIRHAVWDGLRTVYRNLRRAVATREEHGGPALVVDASLDAVRAALGRRSFGPNWEFSYHERGEALNLARVFHEPRTVAGHEYVWWQTHVRGWHHGDAGGAVRLRAHHELEPTEYDQDHVDGVGLDVPRGVEDAAAALDEEGLAYERYQELSPGGG